MVSRRKKAEALLSLWRLAVVSSQASANDEASSDDAAAAPIEDAAAGAASEGEAACDPCGGWKAAPVEPRGYHQLWSTKFCARLPRVPEPSRAPRFSASHCLIAEYEWSSAATERLVVSKS